MRRSRRSARTCWDAANTALPVSTDPTRMASTGEPSIALAADPTARTGVSGSESSSRTAVASSRASRIAAPAVLSTNPAEARAVDANRDGDGAGRSAGGGNVSRTCSTGIACHCWVGVGAGAEAESTPRADSRPVASPAAAPAVTGPVPWPRTPGIKSRPPSSEALVASSMPRRLTRRAAGTACRMRHVAARSGVSTSAPHGGRVLSSSRPMDRSARARAAVAADDTTATVRPSFCSATTVSARASPSVVSTG